VQFGTAVAWWIQAKAPAPAFDVRQLSPLNVVAGLAVVAAGQVSLSQAMKLYRCFGSTMRSDGSPTVVV